MHLPGTSFPRRITFPITSNRSSFAVGLVITVSALSGAHAQTPSAPPPSRSQSPATSQAQSGPVVLSGSVVDPDSAEIPGATLTLTPASGKAFVIKSGADGTYAFHGVPPGVYALTITMPGFASFVRPGVAIGETATTLNAKLAIANQQTVVNVTADENHVSVDQDSNASSTVLKGKDLDALSDDPDELSSELSALAGPSSGPNGGQIYIDGFTGGQLPPKSSIREIRINQNPFSAQYDQPGFGRVEVFTKPGTDKFRLYAQVNGNTRQFNTGSPFFEDNASQPDYHQVFGFGQFSGPITKTASFTVGGSARQIQNDTIVNPPSIFATSTGQLCYPNAAATGCSVFSTTAGNGFTQALSVPQFRWDIRPRVDLALGEKNTLTATFQYEHNNLQQQGIGGNSLPTVGYDNVNSETTLQLSDSQIVSDKIINETRFEYQRENSTTTPYSTLPQISVQGAFTANGSGGGGSNDIQNHIEVQNYTSIALVKNFIRLGGRLRYTGETNTSQSGSTGYFTYTSICDYVPVAYQAEACQGATPPVAPNLASFSIAEIAHPTVMASATDVGLYAETDWKIKPTWTFSYGFRYETQNFIHDHNDWAPRLSTAYGLGKKTVLRAGFGLFYDRFGLGNELNTVRNNGTNQQDYTLTSTSAAASSIASCSPTNAIGTDPASPYGCNISQSRLTVSTISSRLRAPYRIQENAGFDQQLFRNATASFNYQHITGVHEFNSDVPNYTVAAGQTLDDQYQSEGFFNQNQLIVNINVRNFHNGSFGGYYSLNFASSDTGGSGSFASVPNDLRADYGRAGFDVRNRLFLYGSFTLPHLISVGPFIAVNSGSPYNITSGLDEFGDNQFNTRAVLVAPGTTALPTGYVKTIAGCGTFATPGTGGVNTPAPINDCTGPASVAVNVRLTKTWGFGPTITPVGGQNGGPGGGPGGGGPGGGGRSGGGGRGGPGGGGGATSGKRYNLALGVQAQNLFNDANLSTPVGTLSSPSFGHSTSVAGFPFASGSALRRFQFQATFSF